MKLAELRAELIDLRKIELEAMSVGLSMEFYHQRVGRIAMLDQIAELITNKPTEEEHDFLDLET